MRSDQILGNLESYARSHAAINAGSGSVDDVLGFIDYARALERTEADRMTLEELETLWRRRDERYALSKRHLTDTEAEHVREYRMHEAVTLLVGDESRIARNHAYGWDQPVVWG